MSEAKPAQARSIGWRLVWKDEKSVAIATYRLINTLTIGTIPYRLCFEPLREDDAKSPFQPVGDPEPEAKVESASKASCSLWCGDAEVRKWSGAAKWVVDEDEPEACAIELDLGSESFVTLEAFDDRATHVKEVQVRLTKEESINKAIVCAF
jgi:hypothetical protein